MELMLNDEEREVLVEILRARLPDLREEIYKTERMEWREEMKRRERTMQTLLDRLTMVTGRV